MSYPQKRTIVNTITMALIYAAYAFTAFSRHTIDSALRPWAVTMLTFIGITVIVVVIVQIAFHIILSVGVSVKEAVKRADPEDSEIEEALKGEMVEDERDKLIELRASRVDTFTLTGGLMLGLVSIVLGFPYAVMLNLIFGAFFIGNIAKGIVNLILYRKGAIHG